MELPLPPPGADGVADSLIAFARRRGVAVDDELPIAAQLAAIEPSPLVPHPMALVAGAVMALVFRHDRTLAAPVPPDADGLTADRTF